MSACNQTCNQGRQCDCSASTNGPALDTSFCKQNCRYYEPGHPCCMDEEYAASTDYPAYVSGLSPRTTWKEDYMKPQPITMEDESEHPWDWLDDIHKGFLIVFCCASIAGIAGFIWG